MKTDAISKLTCDKKCEHVAANGVKACSGCVWEINPLKELHHKESIVTLHAALYSFILHVYKDGKEMEVHLTRDEALRFAKEMELEIFLDKRVIDYPGK